jgi:hypothetical protein
VAGATGPELARDRGARLQVYDWSRVVDRFQRFRSPLAAFSGRFRPFYASAGFVRSPTSDRSRAGDASAPGFRRDLLHMSGKAGGE